MQDEFLRIQQVLHKSIVFITHDFLEALRVADRMAIMRDGQIVQIGTPAELIVHPADDYVAEFTRDVPLVRVLRAADVADAKAKKANGMAETDAATTVEDLLPLLARNPSGIAVKGARGRIAGIATAQTVVKALAVEGAKREELAEAAPA